MRRDGVRSSDGVAGIADVALLSFSIVGQAEGEGIIMEGQRPLSGRVAYFLTDADA